MNETPKIDFEQDEHDYLLKDIAFEMYQIEKMKSLKVNIPFSQSCKKMNESIKLMENNKKRLIDEYRSRFQKDPDIENAKRLFTRDKEADGIEGREARNANNHNPGTKR